MNYDRYRKMCNVANSLYAHTQQNHYLQKSVTLLANEDTSGMTLIGTALSLTIRTAALLGLFMNHQDTSVVEAKTQTVTYPLLLSLALWFLHSFLFGLWPAQKNHLRSQAVYLGAALTTTVSTVLAKKL